MKLEGKRVLVVGFSRTGKAVCRFLLDRKARIKVSEAKNSAELAHNIRNWEKKGIEFELGGHTLQTFLEAELIIPSPGIPMIPELEKSRNQGIKIFSEIELASRFLAGRIIGITGSNGKSTVATLTHQILKEGGLPSFLAGNIGIPLISFVNTSQPGHFYVTELSSFQLEHTEQFAPSISVFLNITPDHIDWHQSFESYFSAKKKILLRQKPEDTAILNYDDTRIWRLQDNTVFQTYAFSRKQSVSRGCFLKEDQIIIRDGKITKLMPTSEIGLLGKHNWENVMAAALVGHILGIAAFDMKQSIKNFKSLEHRLEKVTTLEGIEFYNDSKATNVDATIKSILSFSRKIILILGGRDKEGDFTQLKNPVAARVKKIILMGEAREKIRQALEGTVPIEIAATMQDAVKRGYTTANSGDIVLLAPACTSFDMYQNYEDRGRAFKQEVLSLQEQSASKRD